MTPSSAAQFGVLDLQITDDLRESGDLQFLSDLLTAFLTDTERRLKEMGHHLDAQDIEVLGRLAHTMKGSCASIGAVGMADCARQIMDLCRAGHLDAVQAALVDLEHLLPSTTVALRQTLLA